MRGIYLYFEIRSLGFTNVRELTSQKGSVESTNILRA